MGTDSLDFFLGPGRALGFGPSTPAPKARFDPVFGLDAFVIVLAPGSFDGGWGVLEPVASSGGEAASGLTLIDFGPSSFAATFPGASGVCLVGGMGEGDLSGTLGAKRASTLLDNLKHTILLDLEPFVVRVDDGGVETFARLLDTRRIELVALDVGGMMSRCRRVLLLTVSYGLDGEMVVWLMGVGAVLGQLGGVVKGCAREREVHQVLVLEPTISGRYEIRDEGVKAMFCFGW